MRSGGLMRHLANFDNKTAQSVFLLSTPGLLDAIFVFATAERKKLL